ncbi:hypothetical protein EYV94_24025 [Puteibacter caeruleilacunae]|nr:hypothetical protein EYV94_24025 [Puteibacter caeruleilacunae]
MKYYLCAVILLLCFTKSYSQNSDLNKTHNIKATFLGLGYAYEHPISSKIALNGEIMLGGAFGYSLWGGDYWLVAPVLRFEPRYYYNRTKREQKGKKLIHNAGNYLSISIDHQLGDISIGDNAESISSYSIIPKWGLKRCIGKNWIFEFAAGIGTYKEEHFDWETAVGLDLKIGYSF